MADFYIRAEPTQYVQEKTQHFKEFLFEYIFIKHANLHLNLTHSNGIDAATTTLYEIYNDLAEILNSPYGDIMANFGSIEQKVKDRLRHEETMFTRFLKIECD